MEMNIRKIDLNAGNPYQYEKLEKARFYFVPCSVEESHDELCFTFDTDGISPLEKSRKMRNSTRYGLLLQVLEAMLENPDYDFPVNPENLYVDMLGRIRVLKRDIRGPETDQILDILALAGYLFQSKYSYQDLREGGLKLLGVQKKTKFLTEIEDLNQAKQLFQSRQLSAKEKEEAELALVPKQRYRRNTVVMGIALAACLILGGYVTYQNYWLLKPQRSALLAERAYMEQDLPAVSDALAGIPVHNMDRHEKYLLAVVYIRGQSVDSFDAATKERLISVLSYNGNEELLDYWIYLGRQQVDEALDIAMRMSDNQLTLYAYLKKLDIVSTDQTLTGQEKTEQVESLKSKIKTLADTLGIEYQESLSEEE